MKPKLLIVGAAGRMGRRILSLAIDAGWFDVIAAIERKDHPDIGKDAGLVAAAGPSNVKLDSTYPVGADVTIDFSNPEAADKTVDYCLENGVALVLGTTGLVVSQSAILQPARPLVQNRLCCGRYDSASPSRQAC